MANVFAFRAATTDGRIDQGNVDASSLAEARELLATRGLYVLDVADHGPRRLQRAHLSGADLALGLRILADLLDSGLSVTRALHALEDLAPTSWRIALPAIQQSIKEGGGLAAALSCAPIAIPPLVVGIIQAGEGGAGLGPAIRQAAEITDAMVETKSAIRAALIYPAIVAVAGVLAVTVLVTVVLPRFAMILADLGQELPLSTRIVLQVATTARDALVPSSICATLALIAAKVAFDTPAGRRRRDRMLLALPVIGRIRRGAAVGRLSQSLSALLATGVPLTAALGCAARSVADDELEARLASVRSAVAGGEPLSRALMTFDAATPTTARLVRAGEESGRLADMLEHASRIERRATERLVRNLVRLLEPGLLLVFAGIVAFVAAALLQAIYSVRPGAG
jgi:type II secretory pathway component PulF